jgi:glycine cleavage system H protein
MTIGPLNFPCDLYYLVEQDVWARVHEDNTATVGITAHGIHLSGEIYMCRAKDVGVQVEQGRAIAVVELAKAILSVKCPVTGEVVETNPVLASSPEIVHTDPYNSGWIARLRLTNFASDATQLARGTQARAHWETDERE